MEPKEELIEVKEYTADGYQPLINYESWRVAILKYCDELLPENITKMQKHNQTDEVFVLLEGECILFLAEGDEEIEEIHAQDMEPLKVYNVKKSVWHTHTLSEDAVVLIVENDDTCLDNSPEKDLNSEQQEKLVQLTAEAWN
ncbi:WxcM-like domain-containing protein [Halanaerobacter jeridensis]|uniref:Uncharacterized protein n=1 Tax=Halanaerobacter jeridensis TaxID=706427 RepID=A0A938XSV0_9FIRM|nr:WxcM-like domain-containing protein [Halanaerobacter jeridensis]MBM7555686.1 hypothetical protein [Halanaerobacter jeridensis]